MPTALVTGAGRGLGLELTRQLLGRGYHVVATARDPGRSVDLARLSDAHGDALRTFALDVADDACRQALARELAAHSVALDLLVHNAGINSRSVDAGGPNVRLGQLEPQGLLRMIEVNGVAPLLLTQVLLPRLQAAPAARVVGISSWLGSIAGKQSGGNYGYCASKSTLNMLFRTLAHDLAPLGITTVVVNPGWVQTEMGGPRASLTPEQSVAGILATVLSTTPADAGRFLQHDGSQHPW